MCKKRGQEVQNRRGERQNEIDKEVGISTCVEPMKVMLFDD